MTAPLVLAEVDLRDFAFMPLEVRRLRDSALASAVGKNAGEEFRAAVLLWCAAWHQIPAASLPDNDGELANLAGYGRSIKEWRAVRPGALRGWMRCDDGRLYHPVVAEKAMESWTSKLQHAYRKAVDRIRKDNHNRKEKGLPALDLPTFEQWNSVRLAAGIPPESDAVSNGNPQENPLKGIEGTDKGEGRDTSSLPTPAAPVVGDGKQKAERLSPAWALPKPWGDWALEERRGWTESDVRHCAEGFRDYWVAKPGREATKLDWLATWRNWVRNDNKTGRDRRDATPSKHEGRAAVAAAILGETDGRNDERDITGEAKRVA